jgi:ABC-type amino acid transport substrate-binding protein
MIARICTSKVMGPFIAISMLGMTAIGADARSLDEILDSKTLKVGVIPYDVDIIKDPNSGEYKGVFVEAIRFVCAEMKVECQFQEYTWQSFVGAIQAGQIDLSIATTYATVPRATAVLFSDPIYDLGYKAVARKDDNRFAKVEDINKADVRVAVPQGTGQMAWVEKVAPEAQIRAVPTEEGALLEVITGQADIAISAAAAAQHALENQASLAEALGGRIYDVNQVSWAMNRKDIDLKFLIDTAIGKLKASGMLRDIAEEYEAPWSGSIAQ